MIASFKKDERITVSLAGADYASLSALAERYDVSLSWIVRKAVSEYLEHHANGELQLPLNVQKSRDRVNS